MTSDEKKVFLAQYRMNEREIARLQEELVRWQSRAERVTAGWGSAAGGGVSEGFPACVEHIAQLQEELLAGLERSLSLRRSIAEAIASVPDARGRLLLHLRYIDGLTWERVAERMEITDRWARLIHHAAIKKIVH